MLFACLRTGQSATETTALFQEMPSNERAGRSPREPTSSWPTETAGSGRLPFVAMMKAADFGPRHDPPGAGRFDSPWLGRVRAQRVRSRTVVNTRRKAAAHLTPADALVDAMRGRFHAWTGSPLNLQRVPIELRRPKKDRPRRTG